MANQPESKSYDAGIYQLETTDPVDGGVGAVSNKPLLGLANRTAYLKDRLDGIEAGTVELSTYAKKDSPTFTGTPVAPTQASGDISNKLATDTFVWNAVNGLIGIDVAGGTTTTLNNAQAGWAILLLTGALTADKAVVLPTRFGHWQVVNATTGAYSLTVKTASGTGVTVTQGASSNIYCDGTNVGLQQTDFQSPALTGTPTTPTGTVGDDSTVVANNAFVQRAAQGLVVVSVAGNANVTLSKAQAGYGIVFLSGALTGNISVIFPNVGKWQVVNNTTGGYTLTCKTSGGSGLPLAQGCANAFWCDGGNLIAAQNDFYNTALTGTPTAPKAAQFATGSQVINADALKAAGQQFSRIRTLDLTVATVSLTVADVGSLVVVNGSGGGTLNLPLASAVPAGCTITVRAANTTTSTNTLKASGSDTLAGMLQSISPAGVMRSGDSVTCTSDGTANWYITADASYNFVWQAINQAFVANQQLTDSGYQKLPGGMILQWGSVTLDGGSTMKTVTLPTTFPNAAAFWGASWQQTQQIVSSVTYMGSADKTSLKLVTNQSSGSYGTRWFVIGY